MTELNALLLRAVLETVAEAIVTTDASGTIVMVNREAQHIWGYQEEELIGQTLTMLMPEKYRDLHTAGMQRYLQTGQARVLGKRVELEGLRKNSEVFPLELSIKETRADGELYFTAAIRDLTEEKLAERRRDAEHRITRTLAESATLDEALPQVLRTICDCLHWQLGGFWSVDNQAGVLRSVDFWGQPDIQTEDFIAVSRSITFAPGIGLPGRVWQSRGSLWIPDVAGELALPRATAAARQGIHAAFGFPVLFDGAVLGVIEFFSNESRQPDHSLLEMMESIGSQLGQYMERVRVRDERRQLIDQLQEALQTRDRFLSIAAHELKTPISSLLGYTQLLERRMQREGTESERNLQALRSLTNQAQRLQRLLTSLLDLSRIQQGQLIIEPGRVDVADLARRAVDEMQPLLERHTLQIQCEQEPLLIEGDDLRLEQVLNNLLQNAVKYSPEGGPIEVLVEARDGHAMIHVRDYGIGIPEEALPQLFSRFFRADNANQRQISGMGIGLFLVKEIVTLHEGEVKVQSSEGGGTTFTIRLPLVTRQQPADLSLAS